MAHCAQAHTHLYKKGTGGWKNTIFFFVLAQNRWELFNKRRKQRESKKNMHERNLFAILMWIFTCTIHIFSRCPTFSAWAQSAQHDCNFLHSSNTINSTFTGEHSIRFFNMSLSMPPPLLLYFLFSSFISRYSLSSLPSSLWRFVSPPCTHILFAPKIKKKNHTIN